jgi:hypothetical protein
VDRVQAGMVPLRLGWQIRSTLPAKDAYCAVRGDVLRKDPVIFLNNIYRLLQLLVCLDFFGLRGSVGFAGENAHATRARHYPGWFA